MARLAFYGNVQPSEYEAMAPSHSVALDRALSKVVAADSELTDIRLKALMKLIAGRPTL